MTHRCDFEAHLAQSWPSQNWQDLGVLLAVSGGADSVALLRAMARLKTAGEGKLVVAHFNHRLQKESDLHEAFVSELSSQLGLEFQLGHPEQPLLQTGGDGLEAAARDARYVFLQATAARLGARYVVTAHTADDQVETILHRVVRGTGLSGLAGIPRVRSLSEAVTLIRPLLGQSRQAVLEYLSGLEQPYCEDATNAEVHFTRNRIRHDLLPLLARDYNPGVGDALLRLGRLAGDAQSVLGPLIDEMLELAVSTNPDKSLVIDGRTIRDRDGYLIREMLKRVWRDHCWPEQSMGFAQWELLAELLLSAKEGRCENLPGEVRAEKRGTELRLVVVRSAD